MTWTLRPGALAAFRDRLHGRLVCPDDRSYDAARRVWNGSVDRRPAIIALCSDTMDVVAAVHFAHEHELVAAVRGGGHSVAGTAVCDGAARPNGWPSSRGSSRPHWRAFPSLSVPPISGPS